MLKVYGYSKCNPDEIVELKEVSLQGDEQSLKAIVKLLNQFIEESSDGWHPNHLHLQFVWKDFSERSHTDIIVCGPNTK